MSTLSPSFVDTHDLESRIEHVEALLGHGVTGAAREVLTCTETTDVRACPGSGKTTLVVAKLALLIPRWISRYRGIAVISHTNVARAEIQKRMTKLPALSRLNSYPHFVGTVQAFIHRFLGIPAATHRFGERPVAIDNSTFESYCMERFRSGPYYSSRAYMGKQQDGDLLVGSLHFSGPRLRVASVKRLPKEGTPTWNELARLKDALSRSGVFRYEDMTALAEWYVEEFPFIKEVISQRFPFVIIDEMQDTIDAQSRLIADVFDGRSVMQRLGDDRQAIFRPGVKDAGGDFPRAGFLKLGRSWRVAPSIARLVENVCLDDVEPLVGNSSRVDRAHCVLLFSRESIARVMPTYCRLVRSEFGSDLPAHEVRAVGARMRSAELAKCPSAIGDYWGGFTEPASGRVQLSCLSDHIRHAERQFTEGRTARAARETLLRASAELLRRQGEVIPARHSDLARWIGERDARTKRRLWAFLGGACEAFMRGQAINESAAARVLARMLSTLWSGDLTVEARAFLDEATTPVEKSGGQIYRSHKGGVRVQMGTIHSVKGETVTAMLLLETFVYTHDLKDLVARGFLTGERPTGPVGIRVADHVKRAYVAMSRPTDLLCLAMLDEHLAEDDRRKMLDLGWTLETVA